MAALVSDRAMVAGQDQPARRHLMVLLASVVRVAVVVQVRPLQLLVKSAVVMLVDQMAMSAIGFKPATLPQQGPAVVEEVEAASLPTSLRPAMAVVVATMAVAEAAAAASAVRLAVPGLWVPVVAASSSSLISVPLSTRRLSMLALLSQ